MPAEHLATQGTGILQQLDALAALHARIRQGQPAVVDTLHVQRADTQQGGDFVLYHEAQLSPSGDCAAVSWYSQDDRHTTRECAAVFGTGTERWRVPLLASTPSLTMEVDWTCDGRYCTALCQRQGAQLTMGTFTSTFDVATRCWLSEVPIACQGGFNWWADPLSSMSLSTDGELAALLITLRTLLVHAVFELCSLRIPARGAMSHAWLPGEHVVLLLGQQGLARVQLSPRPVSSVSLTWVQLACVSAEPQRAWTRDVHGYQQMGIAPDGGTVWVAHLCPDESIAVVGCDTTTLTCVSGPHLLAKCLYTGQNFRPESVCVSRSALAVCTSASYGYYTFVCALEGFASGWRMSTGMFAAEAFGGASFSAEGCFLVGKELDDYGGLTESDTVLVLDARNGDCITSLRLVPPPFSSEEIGTEKLTIAWSTSDPGRLLVTWLLRDSALERELDDSVTFAVVKL